LHLLRKALGRCRRALLPFGYLVVSPADSFLAKAALAAAGSDGTAAGSASGSDVAGGYLLSIAVGESTASAVIIGPGAAQWLSAHRWPAGCTATVAKIATSSGTGATGPDTGSHPN